MMECVTIGAATLYCGDMLNVLPALQENSVDSIVSDPPYGLNFMGKDWDHGVPGPHFWQEALRVAKPGAYLLAFGGTRTYHRLTCAIEDAGWEIRDCIMWVYGSGFPKSLDISKAIDKAAGMDKPWNLQNAEDERGVEVFASSRNNLEITSPATDAAKQWHGWGTALKPAWEPIIVARKPILGTVAGNVLQFGTGGININGCRVPHNGDSLRGGGDSGSTSCHEAWDRPWKSDPAATRAHAAKREENALIAENLGRFPANLIHDGSDEVLALFPGRRAGGSRTGFEPSDKTKNAYGDYAPAAFQSHGDSGSAARFFQCCPWTYEEQLQRFYYCGKATPSDREEGNSHPTVKPFSLMRYLCRMVTPPKGITLDPFMGSGSTGKAAMEEGLKFIGVDLEQSHVDIAASRLETAQQQGKLF